jgi:signal transduction histidine kinase
VMKDCRNNSPGDAKLSLNTKLLLIEVLVFFLPGMVIFYLYYERHLSLDRSHLMILGSMLLMVLGGLITIKQIFDRFLLLNNLIKDCSAGADADNFKEIKSDTKELYEISQSFTDLMNRFNETSNELKERVAEVAEIRQAEVALQNAKKEAEAANAAKTRFLSKRCHELSAPLDSMIIYTGALLAANYGPLNEHQKEFANGILEKGEHLMDLINGIVDYAKMEDEKLISEPAES